MQKWHFCPYCMKTKKNSNDKMLPPVEIEPGPLIASDSKSNTILDTNLTFACKTETLVSIHSHALLIPLKSIKVQISSGA